VGKGAGEHPQGERHPFSTSALNGRPEAAGSEPRWRAARAAAALREEARG
jgi:hypothetical protein